MLIIAVLWLRFREISGLGMAAALGGWLACSADV